MVPETKYARSGNFHIAYQVVGDGPVDLVFVHGWISHIEHLWEEPSLARFLGRLASFSRLILLDKRGTGLSDPVPLDKLPTLEERMDDLRAVMAAAGSERAAMLGTSEAGALNLLFSATHPERTAALILLSSYARLTWAEDYPYGIRPNDADQLLNAIESKECRAAGRFMPWRAIGPLDICKWHFAPSIHAYCSCPSRSAFRTTSMRDGMV